MISKKAFTLVELLIVISILAILSGVTLSVINVQNVRDRANDSVMQENLGTISGALERYYADNNFYPVVGGYSTALTNGGYLKSFPTAPTGYIYSYAYNGSNQNYCLCTTMKQTGFVADKKGCNSMPGNYCVINPF